MSDAQENLAAFLRRAAQRLRGAGLPGELAERMEGLAERGEDYNSPGMGLRLEWDEVSSVSIETCQS